MGPAVLATVRASGRVEEFRAPVLGAACLVRVPVRRARAGASRRTRPRARRGDCRRRRCHVVPLIAPFQLSPDARASLWKQGVGEAAARSEVVAGCGASDRPPDQPASAQSERGKHVLATSAPHLGCGSGSVVRPSLGKAPDPHVIRAHWKPRPWSWDGLARLAASQKW
jgi:hypothetical protein